MNREDDIVRWDFPIRCPACQRFFMCTAAVFPKDSGVLTLIEDYEKHIENCPDFRKKYRKLMGWE